MNKVELLGYYGDDLTHACSAWTSTSRELTEGVDLETAWNEANDKGDKKFNPNRIEDARSKFGNDVVFTRDNGEFNTGALASAPYNNNVGAVRTLMVTSAGVLGYNASTRNTKTNITPLTSVNWLFNLQPVSFNYREKDEEGNYTDVAKADVHYGLIAEDTEKVNKELCFYNADGSLAGVNYDMLAPALLKAIQEMKALVDTQASTIQSLTTRITALEQA